MKAVEEKALEKRKGIDVVSQILHGKIKEAKKGAKTASGAS
jgi:hypothetical protein